MSTTAIVVTAIPGREDVTRRTLEELTLRGGALDVFGPRIVFWTGMSQPPVFPGWRPLWLARQPMGAKVDYWWMLEKVAPAGRDLIVLEDDVHPCKNLLPYLEKWQTPEGCAFTTFFNGRRLLPGRHPAMGPDGRGFWFSQALKLPAWFVAKCAATDVTAGKYSSGQDVALGQVAADAGLDVWYHTSLVQHIGNQSIGTPGATLTGKRAPAVDFVGATFDALDIIG